MLGNHWKNRHFDTLLGGEGQILLCGFFRKGGTTSPQAENFVAKNFLQNWRVPPPWKVFNFDLIRFHPQRCFCVFVSNKIQNGTNRALNEPKRAKNKKISCGMGGAQLVGHLHQQCGRGCPPLYGNLFCRKKVPKKVVFDLFPRRSQKNL